MWLYYLGYLKSNHSLYLYRSEKTIARYLPLSLNIIPQHKLKRDRDMLDMARKIIKRRRHSLPQGALGVNRSHQKYVVQCPPLCPELMYFNLLFELRCDWFCVKSANLLALYRHSTTTLLEHI